MTRALNRYENYMVDTGIPKHHIQFNGIYDLPFGRGKQFLGNSNHLVERIGRRLPGCWQRIGYLAGFCCRKRQLGTDQPDSHL